MTGLQEISKQVLEELEENLDLGLYKSGVFPVTPETLQTFRDVVQGKRKATDLSVIKKEEEQLPLFIENLSETTKKTIWALYPEKEFLLREFIKMHHWLAMNGHKAPRSKHGWARFVMSWLSRGWEVYRKGLQGKKGEHMDWKEVFK